MRGETLVSLALKNRLSESYLRGTLIRPMYRGEQIIARFIGVAPQVIWPNRYFADGTPRYQRKQRRRA